LSGTPFRSIGVVRAANSWRYCIFARLCLLSAIAFPKAVSRLPAP
jgi:hypothetical protein